MPPNVRYFTASSVIVGCIVELLARLFRRSLIRACDSPEGDTYQS